MLSGEISDVFLRVYTSYRYEFYWCVFCQRRCYWIIVDKAVKLVSSRSGQRKIPFCAQARSTVAAVRKQAIGSNKYRNVNCERWLVISV